MTGRRATIATQVGILLVAVFLSIPFCNADPADSTVSTEEEKKLEASATIAKLMDEGLRYQNAGQFEIAIEKYQAALALTQNIQAAPRITAVLFSFLGISYFSLGRWQEAAEAANQALHLEPGDAITLNLLGLAYNQLGRSQEAIQAYKEAVRIRSDYALAYHGLGDAYRSLGRYREAAEAYKEAVRLQPDYALAHHSLGQTYRDLSQYQEAVEAFKEAIRIQPDFTLSHLELGLTYDKMAGELGQQGRYAEAARLGERALEIYERNRGSDHSDSALFLNNLAGLYSSMGDYAKALPLYERALAIQEKVLGPDHPNTAVSLNNLAGLYSSMGDYAKALPLYERALAIQEKVLDPNHPDTAGSLNNLATLYDNMGEYAKALPLHERALAIREKTSGPDHPDTATSLNNLAFCHYNMGNYQKATSLSQKVLAIREKALGPDHPDTVLSLNNLSVLYGTMGEYAEALPFSQQALVTREKVLGPNHPDTAQSLNNLAGLYSNMGDYAKALPLYERALAIREKVLGPNHPDTAQSLNNLAGLYSNMGDYAKALPLYERALAIREKVLGPDHPDTAVSLNNLAELYKSVGEYAKALALHQQTLAIREKALGPDHPDTAVSLNNLAALYKSPGEYAKALPLYQRALAIQEKALGPDHPDTARSLNNLATSYAEMGKEANALSLYERVLAIWEKVWGSNHLDTILSLNNLAVMYWGMKDYAKALQFLQRGLVAEDHIFASVFSIASEDQKRLFAEKSQSGYLATLSLIHRHFQNDAQAVRFGLELVLRRKGIVLDAQARTQEALAANLTGETLESWQRLTQHRSVLSRLLLGGPGEQRPEDYRQRIEELHAAIAREEEALAQRSGLVAQELAQRQVTVPMLAGRLPKDGALAEFVRIRDWDEERKRWSTTERYLAFVLTPDNQVTLVDLGEAEKIDAKIGTTLTAINPPDFARVMETASRQADAELADLYTLLLQPLETALGVRRRLIVSPDGELNKVPFAALRIPDGHYLIEKMTLSYVASGRDLLRGKTGIVPSVNLLLAANPAFDDREVFQVAAASGEAVRAADYRKTFPPLPGTAEEARIIPPLIKGTHKVLEGKEATESAVRMTRSPKVLHLATHGFFLKDEDLPLPDLLTRSANGQPAHARVSPMVRAGLALAGANHAQEIPAGDDGLLTALEVSGMNLYGTDLVVLSACETAAGDVKVGEGVYGLRRAFVLAGAKNLVMSLWPVGDQTTREQMEAFYRAYGEGKTPAEALRQAQLQTLAHLREMTKTMKEPLTPVKLWAPFIVQQTGE